MGLAAAAALLATSPAAAGSIEIAPTTIEVPARAGTAVVYITNHGDQAIVAQVQAYDWRQTDKGEQLDPSTTLSISPPMARVPPGQRQTIRLAITPDPGATTERSFRLLISELPDPSGPATLGVRVMLQFSVPVFAAGKQPRQAQLVWSLDRDAAGVTLTARNDGTLHAKLVAPALITADGKRIAATPAGLAYILPGAAQRWTIPASDLRPGEDVHVSGRDDADGNALDATLAIPR
ncbi:MAG TPA: fimbria/pilus periplasmic chaperone [Rhizomicrobium sp.]|nr:fimbria/pilus periplasmic chaperone [Rhizomicrobium sp.]